MFHSFCIKYGILWIRREADGEICVRGRTGKVVFITWLQNKNFLIQLNSGSSFFFFKKCEKNILHISLKNKVIG